MANTLRQFLRDASGATAIEYGLIIAVLSLAIVAGVGSAGNRIEYMWGNNNSELNRGLNSH
jgi:Flp pilus assembly protein, pilin Flp